MRLIKIFFVVFLFCGISACKSKTERNNDPDKISVASDAETENHPIIQQNITLHDAAFSGDIEACKSIIKSGADVNAINPDGYTSLMLAAFNGHSEIVKELLKNGAEINQTDTQGLTPLHFAASGPFPETIRILLENGSDINVPDNIENFTPLMYAASEGNIEVVKVLLEYNADLKLTDDDGDTAESFARQNNHHNVVELLTKRK